MRWAGEPGQEINLLTFCDDDDGLKSRYNGPKMERGAILGQDGGVIGRLILIGGGLNFALNSDKYHAPLTQWWVGAFDYDSIVSIGSPNLSPPPNPNPRVLKRGKGEKSQENI